MTTVLNRTNTMPEALQIRQLKAQIAALEELLEVQEQTVLAQGIRLERELQLRQQAEVELRAERTVLETTVAQQQQLIETIKQLSAPLLPLNDEVLLLPLIGAIDARRSTQILETLLLGVQQYQVHSVIIDITGVQVIDLEVANHLMQAARAVRLLGARCMLVGISPDVAQTLVQLGIDFGDIITQRNLQAGIAYAIARPAR